MAIFFEAKRPADVRRYDYKPELAKGDGIASFTLTLSGAVDDASAHDGEVIEVFVSGGTAGQTASALVEIVTNDGEELSETIYIPIIASAAQIAQTAQEYCFFALRRIVGIGEVPSADELNDALERLSAMIASWRAQGADIGAPFPLEGESVIYCPDYAVEALRFNLLLDVASLYGVPVAQMEAMKAARGLQLVKNMNQPEDRAATYF